VPELPLQSWLGEDDRLADDLFDRAPDAGLGAFEDDLAFARLGRALARRRLREGPTLPADVEAALADL
jgi:hypothetical protein